ncbi:MAG: hypothetical protein HY794_05875 [Desulfarculus sp.]|nr:hypothetical protein [Desulfarculus sp.]
MREHPLLFKGAMVQALLAGRKTQTRRVVTWHNSTLDGAGVGYRGRRRALWDSLDWGRAVVDPGGSIFGAGPYFKVPSLLEPGDETWHRVCSIHQPGDFIWVKETWAPRADNPALTHYRASPPSAPPGKWRPAIHRPRQRSRISLEIARAAAQWLWDISEEDALAEGVERLPSGLYRNYLADMHFEFARTSFASLWDAVNGPRGLGWEANRPVWAIAFQMPPGDHHHGA